MCWFVIHLSTAPKNFLPIFILTSTLPDLDLLLNKNLRLKDINPSNGRILNV